jgi:TM2 domain-containing membrane protein YozV
MAGIPEAKMEIPGNDQGFKITLLCGGYDVSEAFSLFESEAKQPDAARPLRSAPVAAMLSLLLPGAGHLYCGKTATGIWTLGTFALATAIAAWLQASAGSIGYITLPLPIYIVGCADAYWTTKEANAGRDCLPNGNPRIAFVLNLMTWGIGYFIFLSRGAEVGPDRVCIGAAFWSAHRPWGLGGASISSHACVFGMQKALPS